MHRKAYKLSENIAGYKIEEITANSIKLSARKQSGHQSRRGHAECAGATYRPLDIARPQRQTTLTRRRSRRHGHHPPPPR